jgi:hypothetical protein
VKISPESVAAEPKRGLVIKIVNPDGLKASIEKLDAEAREAKAILGFHLDEADLERYGDVTLKETIEQGRRGYRGVEALDAALSARAKSVARSASAPSVSRMAHSGRTVSRPREHRAKSSRTRTTSRGDPDDPDPVPRSCVGCGERFTPTNPRQRYHSEACGNAARQRKHKAKARASEPFVNRAPDPLLSGIPRSWRQDSAKRRAWKLALAEWEREFKVAAA